MPRLAAALAAAALAWPGAARADQPAYFDGEAAMTGGANTALVHGAGAAWYNPAGLHDGSLNWFDLSASAFVLRVRDFSRVFQADLPGRGLLRVTGDSVDVQPIPSALVYQRRLSASVTAALGVFVTQFQSYDAAGDFHETVTFPGRPTPLLLEGRANLSRQAGTYHIGPSVSWQLSRRVRLGASLYLVYDYLLDASLARVTISDAAGLAEASASFRRQRSAFGGQTVLAAQLEPVDGLHLGLVLRGPVLSFGQLATFQQEVTGFSVGGDFDGPDFAVTTSPSLPDPAGRLVAPPKATLALAYRHPRFWIGVEGDFSPGLHTAELGLDERAQVDVRAGARVWLGDVYSIGFGAFTDRATRPDPSIIGDHVVDYYGGAAGFHWSWRYPVTEKGQRRTLVFSSSVAARYAVGVARLAGALYAPKAVTFDALSHLSDSRAEGTFHAVTLQLESGIRW